MQSVFGFSNNLCVLFQAWHITNSAQYAGSWFLVACMGVLRELIQSMRPVVADCCRGQPHWRVQLAASAMYAFTLAASYLLMLVFMTYEVGLCIAVVVGCFLGNFTWSMLLRRQRCDADNTYTRPASDEATGYAVQRLPLNGGASSDTPVFTEADHCCDNVEE